VSHEIKEKNKTKPYDPKKSVWVPNKADGGYLEGLLESKDGAKVSVKVGGEVKVFKEDQVCQVNPPKFDCSDDMADLTFLGDACVLWNSVVRYVNQLIYTYSGLFCIAINPYKRFPIYTLRTMEIYVGKRRNECPPHIFAIAEGAYQGMMNSGCNQSILITGESGAGKTENTKKVISYFATICSSGKKKEGEASLEDKIVQTNPVLEAWGNAKTVRNDNSSRFGKFIRIHFNASGKLSGADMVVYLLEKSRLTYQQPLERCYHAFYNIMSDEVPDLKEKCLLSNEILDYWYVSQGKLTVPSIDDREDMQFANEAFDILGFTETEKYDVFKNTACMMHMGNMTKDFVPVGKEEQAEIKDEANAMKVSELMGIDCEWMITYFCKPKLKVGTEWVQKGSTCAAASNSVAGIARSIYERTFKLVVDKCNETLIDPTMKKVQYIGVLDIAGFEIFDYNGFEQICINYVNEKLQQFFNQHMFTLEQEEYVKEGLDWANVDFGMDLQKCIDMFEKPMALLAIFEEESLFPKATDETFCAKLHANLLGKWENFAKPNPRPDPDAHFAVIHYAATVSYNLTGWLEKNKDPLNDTIVEMIKNGGNAMMVQCFADHPGQPLEAPKDDGGRKKKGGGKTVSSYFKGQLDDLMTTLYKTEPHFIRCVVPNTHKIPGGVESGLVMHQYQCNGVLAGIAICRKGFPNKMMYPEFKARYNILAAKAVAKAKNDKAAAGAVMDVIKLDKEKFRLGHTKVFFRAGILGYMEEVREDRIGQVLAWLQAGARGKASRMQFKKLQDQKLALYCCQRSIRNYYIGKTWMWWQIWLAIKPNLKCTQFGKYKQKYEDQISLAEANIGDALAAREKVQASYDSLQAQKNELELALRSGGSAVQDIIDKTTRVEGMASEVQKSLDGVLQRIEGEKEQKAALEMQISQINNTVSQLQEETSTLGSVLGDAEQERADKDEQISALKDEISHQVDLISKLSQERKNIFDLRQKTDEDIQKAEDKSNHLAIVKAKLEQSLDEAEDVLDHEKKIKVEVEKSKKKAIGDLKLAQEAVSNLERTKTELCQIISQKEKEQAALSSKIEDEASLGSKYAKQIKELQTYAEELDVQLTHEHGNNAKAQKSLTILKKDVENINSHLEEAGSITAIQVELNNKREGELARLEAELGELHIAKEGTVSALRQKHSSSMADLGEQLDAINAHKIEAEKDKASLELDLVDARTSLEDAVKGKAELDKQGKLYQASIIDANSRLDDLARVLNESESSKKRLQVENQDLNRQIQELETGIANANISKISLVNQLQDSKSLTESESKDKATLLTKYKDLSTELENLSEQIENESLRKSDALKALSKAKAEIQLWKSRYETEGLSKVEELECARARLQSRIAEAEEDVDALTNKIACCEKSKGRISAELDEVSMEQERVHAAALITKKRGENFDKVLCEWQTKVADITAEVDASQDECRNYKSELFRLKAAQEDVNDQLDIVKRENKNSADEIIDLLDQLGDGGRTIHDLDRQRKNLETEKDELQTALEAAEGALEQEENKVLRSHLELSQARQDLERRLAERKEMFNNTCKNHQRAMESMSTTLEVEQKSKAEALRLKKKLEAEISQLEIQVDHASKANAEGLKAIKQYQMQIGEVNQAYETEALARAQVVESVGIAERKAATLAGEVEECNVLLSSTDRACSQVAMEIEAARHACNEMQAINGREFAAKRALEGTIHTVAAEIDVTLEDAKLAEERAKQAMVDAARLADELCSEQDHVAAEASAKKALESQMHFLEEKLRDVEAAASRGGKATLAKHGKKITQLEAELSSMQSRTAEYLKAHQRAERRVKEMSFARTEDKQNAERMSVLAGKIQQKLKTYKQQIEVAEEIAGLNLAKFRKAQQQLEEEEERTKMAAASIEAAD